ncbi:hypothetical protein ACJIZ3_003230 [Penstemon smallii]|uniref:Uncharacterized protein n=1 Tax=Penstemon smallii TaxID=265156 RepID=A0ABD3UC22_9LAMI
MTAMLAMTEHSRKKRTMWSQIFSEETKKQCIPVITAWQLNERMYGELQGLNKQETADRYGTDQLGTIDWNTDALYFKEGRFIHRGSPVAPIVESVYAYTKNSVEFYLFILHLSQLLCSNQMQSLAQYRQKLDERFQS